jgi:hypothetical protein
MNMSFKCILFLLAGWYIRWWFDIVDWRFNRRWEYGFAILKDRCRYADDIEHWQRPLYTVKAFLCLALNLESQDPDRYGASTAAGVLNQTGPHGEYSAYSWDEARVGLGLFKNWFWEYNHDTSA